MSILVNDQTQIICHGVTGRQGSLFVKRSLEYGNSIFAGISPKKGGIIHLGVSVYSSLSEVGYDPARAVSIIFVPAEFCKDVIIDALKSGIKLIVCITEGLPVHDMLQIIPLLKENNAKLIGPNTFGIIVPGIMMVGVMPCNIFTTGRCGVVSRSGTLAYEVVNSLTRIGLGQSTCIGVGGDPISGVSILNAVLLLDKDKGTDFIVVVGEIGGYMEDELALNIGRVLKPVIVYIVGESVPKGKRMGHAGAIIAKNDESAIIKKMILKKAGALIAESPLEVALIIKKLQENSILK